MLKSSITDTESAAHLIRFSMALSEFADDVESGVLQDFVTNLSKQNSGLKIDEVLNASRDIRSRAFVRWFS
jgi:hypothetical protein